MCVLVNNGAKHRANHCPHKDKVCRGCQKVLKVCRSSNGKTATEKNPKAY